LQSFGIIEIDETDAVLDMCLQGNMLALFTHSGFFPRGNIGGGCKHWGIGITTRLAISKRRLPAGSKTSCMAYDG